MRIVILGLSITSSWGNGHASTYRGLVRELSARGNSVLFLERDVPWYAQNRDLPNSSYADIALYSSLAELKHRFTNEIRQADAVIVGSFVPEGIAVGEWITSTAEGVKAFYDIDTPVTLANLERGAAEYINKDLIPRYDLYLSFTGGALIEDLERRYGARKARVLYCSFDPSVYYPDECKPAWDLGYLGTYSADRQPSLEALLLEPARGNQLFRMVVAGPLYPPEINWPRNVERLEHLSPQEHRSFYNVQRFTLNLTRADMIRVGYSPSVRLFEAAACGTPIISDCWPGLDCLFDIGSELLVARSSEDIVRFLTDMPEEKRVAIGARARRRVLAEHTAAHRSMQLECYIRECLAGKMYSGKPAA